MLIDAHSLLSIFEQEVDPLYRAWHLPTLQAHYTQYYQKTPAQKSTNLYSLALVLSMLSLSTFLSSNIFTQRPPPELMACLFLHPSQITGFDAPRLHFARFYLSAALFLLDRSDHTIVECLQADLMCGIAISLFGANRVFLNHLSGVVKKAQILGIHIDPIKTGLDLSPRQQEERRRLWWTIQTLDCINCLTLGLPLTSQTSDINRMF